MTRHRVIALGFMLLAGVAVFVWFARSGSLSTPATVQISIASSNVSPRVVTGSWVAFLVAPDGSLWGWGDNTLSGLLSTNRAANWTAPRQFGTNTDWIDVGVAAASVVLVKNNGTIWGWDLTGANGPQGVPRQLSTNAGWRSISGGASHFLALKDDGTLWAWGKNFYGQLGDGTFVDQSAPVQVGTNRNWQAITTGAFLSMGLQVDGSLWCWGMIDPNQPASPRPRNTPEPAQVGTGKEWIAIAAGGYHCVAQQSDGNLWLWGPNAAAIVGPIDPSNSLVGSYSGERFERIAAGTVHCLALAKDGSLWGWGLNSRGALARLPSRALMPARIDDRKDWVDVWSRGDASFALAADGTLWTWGVRLGEPMETGFGDRISQWTGNVLRRFGVNTSMGQSVSPTPRFTPKPWPIARFVPAKQETREE